MKHLEPVVKKSKTYNILFLRDDDKVVRFRLKPFWIKFLALIFVIFSSASGAAGYAAHYYWKKYNALQRERIELKEELGENRRDLGRFAGVERIKESTLPYSTMAGVTSITSGPDTNGKGEDGEGASTAAEPRETTSSPTPNGSPSETAPKPETASSAAETGGTPSDQSVQTAPPANTELSTAASGEHPALVSDVQARPTGNKNFKLAFALSNRDPQLTLNGRVHVAVAAKSGTRHEITQTNRDALRFIINNYKRVSTTFVLPADLDAENIDGLFLTVTADGLPPVTYRFPIPTPP